MTLAELMALLAIKATRMKAILAQDSCTDEEKEEKRTLLTECEGLKTDIEERKAQDQMITDLDISLVVPPAGKQPGTEGRAPVIIEAEPPVYETYGDQLIDIIIVGKNGANAGEARERLAKAETRMIAEKTLDLGLKLDLEKEARAAGTPGQSVGIAADGGGFVQTDFAVEMVQKGYNNSALLPKTQKRKMSGNSNSIEIYGIDEDSRADGSRNGGVVVYTKAELEQYTSSKAKFKGFELKVNKLTGLLFLSDEIMEDAAFLQGEVTSLFNSEFEFKTQNLLWDGSGAGEPLGIRSAACKVDINKETSQPAKTIVAANIDNMIARSNGGNAQFFGNRDIYPQLAQLYRKIGTNSITPLYKPTGLNTGILNGVPLTFIEQAATLGTAGDLMLCDFSTYVTATKGKMKKAESIHLKFDYGQKAIRFTLRFDGQPRWRSALTPYKGSNTISPFIGIKVRA
jgi:HK97 family phage major capsid protein